MLGRDLCSLPSVWKDESPLLLVDLCGDGGNIRYGPESVRHRGQVVDDGGQPVLEPLAVRVRNCGNRLHCCPNELLQQGSQRLSADCVSPKPLPGEASANIIVSVSPIYYVTFTTAVLTASFILFQVLNITDEIRSASLLCGFITIFTGVYLLNFNGSDIEQSELAVEYELVDGTS